MKDLHNHTINYKKTKNYIRFRPDFSLLISNFLLFWRNVSKLIRGCLVLIVIARIRSCFWRGFNLSNLYSSLSHWLRSIALAAWHRQKAENQLSVPFNFLYILCPFWYSTEFDIKALLGKGRRLAWKLWPRHVMKLFLFPCPPRSNFSISRLICNNTTYFVFCHEAWDFWTPSHRPLPSFDKHLGSSPIFTLLIRDPCKLLPRLTFPRKQTFHTIFPVVISCIVKNQPLDWT